MRKLACLAIGILLIAVLAVPALAAEPTTFTLTADKSTVYKGDEVTVTVSVSGTEPCTSLGILLSYDKSVFEYVSQTNGTLTNQLFINWNGSGWAVVFSGATAPNGTLGTVTLRAIKDAPDTACVISGAPSVKNGSASLSSTVDGSGSTVTASCHHSFGAWKETPATCIEAGSKTRSCSICGKVEEQTIPALNHDLVTRTTPSTCTVQGSEVTSCTRCDYTETKILPLKPHDFAWVVNKESTCTEQGSSTQVCKVCETEGTTETLPLADHKYSWVVTQESTCKDEGVESYKCSVCGEVSKTRSLPLAPHQFSAPVVTKEPTCTEPGEETGTCKVCGQTTTQKIDALDHDWGDWTVTTPATCEEDGVETRTCKNDAAHTETRTIKALDHDWGEWTVTTPPTCTEDGVKTRICNRDDSHVETDVVPALNHDYDPKLQFDEEGHWQVCKVCGDTTPKENHVCNIEVELEPSTTTEHGKAQLYCECGYTNGEIVELPLLSDDYDDVPKTGDITGQIVLYTVSAVAMIVAVAYVFKRKAAK